MDRLFRSNSSVSSKSSVPLDIINEEDYSIEETNFTDFKKWCIPKVDIESIYRTSWVQSTFNSQFNVRTLCKHILFQELMKSVVCLIEEVLIIFLQRNSVICILD